METNLITYDKHLLQILLKYKHIKNFYDLEFDDIRECFDIYKAKFKDHNMEKCILWVKELINLRVTWGEQND